MKSEPHRATNMRQIEMFPLVAPPVPISRIPAMGTRHGRCQRKVVCLLDDETFAELRSEAIKRGTSFSHILRELVEIGLETVKLS